MQRWRSLFRFEQPAAKRDRLKIDMSGKVVYAIGDVHGCFSELKSLESIIQADSLAFNLPKLIIMLGDYVDRGPESAYVLDHLLRPPPIGFQRICLAGNHEVAMLLYLDGKLPREAWLASGGRETLFSYGLDADHLAKLYGSTEKADEYVRRVIPDDHVRFLRSLPIMVYSSRLAFVHAGIKPGVALEDQEENDLLFIRTEFFDNTDLLDRWIVHGHTPIRFPRAAGRRINIDTGAFRSGRLTAIRIAGDKGKLLFS